MVDIQVHDKGNGLVAVHLDHDATDVVELFAQHDQRLHFYIVDTKDQRVKRALRQFCGPPVTLYDSSGRRTLKPPDDKCAAKNATKVLGIYAKLSHEIYSKDPEWQSVVLLPLESSWVVGGWGALRKRLLAFAKVGERQHATRRVIYTDTLTLNSFADNFPSVTTTRPTTTEPVEVRRVVLDCFYDLLAEYGITLTLFHMWDDLSFVNNLRDQVQLDPQEGPRRQSFQLDKCDLTPDSTHKIMYVHVKNGKGKATIGSEGTYVHYEIAETMTETVEIYVILDSASYASAINDVNHPKDSTRYMALATLHHALENAKNAEETSTIKAIVSEQHGLRQDSVYTTLPYSF